jgi:AraC family transcriptional regulator, chitin signaling transcriptional activator
MCAQANEIAINGLVQASSIVQDEQGFVWLSGQHGLTRYDGSSVITFAENAKSWSSPFTWVHDVILVGDKLAISTERNGSWIFDPKSGIATSLPLNIDNMSHYNIAYFQQHYYVYSLKEKALYQFDPNTNQTRLIQQPLRVQQLISNDNALYFSSKEQVFSLVNNVVTPIYQGAVEQIAIVGKQLVIATDSQLLLFNNKQLVATQNKNAVISAMAASHDQQSIFTVSKQGELWQFDGTNLMPIKHHFSVPSKTGIISKIQQDNAGGLWFISSQGVYQSHASISTNYSVVFNVFSNFVVAKAVNQQIWLGSNGEGLAQFNRQVSGHKIMQPVLNQQLSAKGLHVNDLLVYEQDLLIATFDGLWRYNPSHNRLTQLELPDKNQVILHLSRHQQRLYLATDGNGFYIFDLVKNKVIFHGHNQHIQGRFSSLEIIDILPVTADELWLATAEGVDIYHASSNSIQNIELAGNTKVISLTQTDDKIFVATKGSGIFVFNHQAELLTRLNQSMSFSYIRAIDNVVWAPSTAGLYKITPSDYRSMLIANTETLSFTDSPFLVDNKLYVAHYGGLLELPLNAEPPFHANVQISKTTISGAPQLTNNLINIGSANDVVTLQLASLDFRPGQEKQFQYRINNNSWHPINGTQLTLTGLASGRYDIEIKATNSLGQWSNKHAFTSIEVAYPWYWTAHMRVLYLLLITLIILFSGWLLYLRTKSIKYIYHLLRNDLKSRGKTALNVMHSLTIAQQKLAKLPSNDDISALQHLLQQSIDELGLSNTGAEPSNLMGNSLISALPYLANFILKKFHVEVICDIEFDEQTLSLELQSDLYRVIFEAITSAIRNSNGSHFHVRLKEFKGKLWLTIKDNKRSFVHYNNKIHFTVAMYYIRQIANKYQASVNTYDEQEQGSQLLISIPLML